MKRERFERNHDETHTSLQEACLLAEQLKSDRLAMFTLVQMRMSLIAPNMVALLGPEAAASLVSQVSRIR